MVGAFVADFFFSCGRHVHDSSSGNDSDVMVKTVNDMKTVLAACEDCWLRES